VARPQPVATASIRPLSTSLDRGRHSASAPRYRTQQHLPVAH
jgi:hypothetical protein